MYLDKYFLFKQILAEEENEVENEDELFSNEVVIDYSVSYSSRNDFMVGDSVRSNQVAK